MCKEVAEFRPLLSEPLLGILHSVLCKGSENRNPPQAQPWGAASAKREHLLLLCTTAQLAELGPACLFWPHYLSTLMGKRDCFSANFLPSLSCQTESCPLAAVLLHPHFPFPTPKSFFFKDFVIQNQENTEKELEIERTETKGKNLGREKKKKESWAMLQRLYKGRRKSRTESCDVFGLP